MSGVSGVGPCSRLLYSFITARRPCWCEERGGGSRGLVVSLCRRATVRPPPHRAVRAAPQVSVCVRTYTSLILDVTYTWSVMWTCAWSCRTPQLWELKPWRHSLDYDPVSFTQSFISLHTTPSLSMFTYHFHIVQYQNRLLVLMHSVQDEKCSKEKIRVSRSLVKRYPHPSPHPSSWTWTMNRCQWMT